jgi:membrane fusion protein (multidrug efflux system)
MDNNNTVATAAASAPVAKAGNPKRRRALTALAAVVIVAGGGWGLYEWLVASHYEDTDNAYVQGNVIQITPQVTGTVLSIMADDTDFVKAGQPLVQLDPADAKLALAQSEAALGQAVRQVRTLYANNGSLAAQVTLKQADIAKAQSDIARAQDDLKRRQALTGNGAVSKEELNHSETALSNAKSALAAAQAGVASAREQLTSNQSLTEGTSVEQHPNVLAAAAKVRESWLAVQRVALPAPVDGYVAKRTVQLGQRVAAGTPMMSIVRLCELWVDAKF